MKLSPQTSNIINGTKWQQLRDTRDSAYSVISILIDTYTKLPATKAVTDITNSMVNLRENNVTLKQFIEWVEMNQGYRIKNKKDYQYIVHTIAQYA